MRLFFKKTNFRLSKHQTFPTDGLWIDTCVAMDMNFLS